MTKPKKIAVRYIASSDKPAVTVIDSFNANLQ